MDKDEQTLTDGASPASGEPAKTEVVDSSATAAAVDPKPDSTTGSDGATGKPEGEGVKKPQSILEAMLEAQSLDAPRVAKAGESPDSTSAGKPDAEPKAEAAAPAEGADKGKPAEKNAETRLQELLAERKDWHPQAQNWVQLQSWVKQNGLTQAEFEGALNLAAALKKDPVAAHRMLAPVNERLAKIVGDVLPPDLKAKVEAGTIDEATAKELALSRSRAAISERSRTTAEAERRENEEAAQFAANVRDIAATVSGWENQWKGSDPDYQRKQPLVTARIKAIMLDEGYPKDRDAALAQAKRARAEVEKELAEMLPKPQPKKVIVGGTSGTAAAKPRSHLEAMKAELARQAA